MERQAEAVGAAAKAAEVDRLGLPSAMQAAHRAQLQAVVAKRIWAASDALSRAAQLSAHLTPKRHQRIEELVTAVDALKERHGQPAKVAYRAKPEETVVDLLWVAGDALSQAALSAANLGLVDHRQLEELAAAVDTLRERHDG